MGANLPKAMKVRYVEIFSSLPKTQTEKIQRAELRKLGQSGMTGKTWDHDLQKYWTGA